MAIQLPNNKISRTLPEQVGFNSAKIEEIIKFLNESGLKDLVINLESDSGTLSTDQYAIAELSPSYMVYDGAVFYKVYEDSDYIDYFLLQEKVDTINSDLAVSKWRIRVERDNRNYALEEISVFTSYNKSQIDFIVSTLNSSIGAKAALSGAAFTGAITAPSIIEDMTGYSFTQQTIANLTIDPVYAGVVKNGNKITFVYACEVTRTGELGYVSLAAFTIPAAVAEKIHVAIGLVTVDKKAVYCVDRVSTTDKTIPMYMSKSVNDIQINTTELNQLTLNNKYYIRYEATFLLSDSLI